MAIHLNRPPHRVIEIPMSANQLTEGQDALSQGRVALLKHRFMPLHQTRVRSNYFNNLELAS